MVQAHEQAETKESKLAILSLLAPYFPYNMTEDLFCVDHDDVYKAKLHAAEGLAGVQLERLTHRRFRMDAQKFSFIHQWVKSGFASKDGDAGQDDTQLR